MKPGGIGDLVKVVPDKATAEVVKNVIEMVKFCPNNVQFSSQLIRVYMVTKFFDRGIILLRIGKEIIKKCRGLP